jgi:hypothetical protein
MRRFMILLLSLAALAIPSTSWEASKSENLAITVTATEPAMTTVQSPGPSQALFNSRPYACTANYYVSPTGSSSNPGTQAQPWDITTGFNHSSSAGTCINIADGTYTPSTTLIINSSGNAANPTGYVVYRAYQTMDGPHIFGTNDGGTDIIDILGKFVWIDGLNLDGNETGQRTRNCVLATGNTTGTLTNGTGSHHHYITNSILQNCGQAGFQGGNTDYQFLIHDTVYHNSWNPPYVEASGISIYEPLGPLAGYTRTSCSSNCTDNLPMAYDNFWCATGNSVAALNVCYDLVVAYTFSYNNYDQQTGATTSDGEGYESDDWAHSQNSCSGLPSCPYTGNGLVLGNAFYFNGGPGYEINGNASSGVVAVINNTAYDNFWDPHDTSNIGERGDFEAIGPIHNQYYINNIAQSVQSSCRGCANYPFVVDQNGETGSQSATFQNNVANTVHLFANTSLTFPTSGSNKNLENTLASFQSASPGTPPATLGSHNFALQSASPAIGFGQSFSIWQQTGSVDAGACVSGLSSCP